MAILPVGIGPQEGGYQVERSLRFNSADSAYLSRTPASAGNRKTWTWSGWVKRSKLGANGMLLCAGASGNSNDFVYTDISGSDYLRVQVRVGGVDKLRLDSAQVFRDPSAWYHFVLQLDLNNATQSDRFKMYVNGNRITAFSTNTNTLDNTLSPQVNNTVLHYLGNNTIAAGDYFNGYLTEVHFIDGSALDPTSFGEYNTDTGVWQPKAYTGSYGTNGFYLDFADNSNNTATTLGKDSSGNGNNWTPNNFVVTTGVNNDSLVDTPTPYGTDTGAGGEVRGNYCTMNPLDSKNGTASNGNLLWTATASQSDIRGTFAIPTSGKWYMECTVGSNTSSTSAVSFGLATSSVALDASNAVAGLYQLYASNSGYLSLNGTNVSSSLGAWTAGDVLQIAVDVDNTKMWLGKNNTWYNSSGGTTGNPSTGANATSTTSMVGLFPFSNCYQNNATWNAGQRLFAYTAPSGFKALCTQNLPEPTVVDGSQYFDATTYTGNGTAGRVITVSDIDNVGLAWVKIRSGADDHRIANVVTGGNKHLKSNATDAESTGTNIIQAFSGNTFTVGSDLGVNSNGSTYVAWTWAANGAGVTNTAGTITGTVTVSANTTAGFSIVTYTNGTGTVGHGLGSMPAMVIYKGRGPTAANWGVLHQSLSSMSNHYLNLNTTGAQGSGIGLGGSPTSSVIYTNGSLVPASEATVAYCFAPIAGYSAFGSYTGNGSTDGPFVFTNHRPAFLLIKCSSAGSTNWVMIDVARTTYNVGSGEYLLANDSGAEGTGVNVDILSNGFKLRNTGSWTNSSGATYIYAAFAENPFSLSLAR